MHRKGKIQNVISSFLGGHITPEQLTTYGETLVIGRNDCPLQQCLKAVETMFPQLGPWVFTMEPRGLMLHWQYEGPLNPATVTDTIIDWDAKKSIGSKQLLKMTSVTEDIRLVCVGWNSYKLSKASERNTDDSDGEEEGRGETFQGDHTSESHPIWCWLWVISFPISVCLYFILKYTSKLLK